jgi:ADP-heptose:LPS heptosyltransferase/GT2 family glycosyltransferase
MGYQIFLGRDPENSFVILEAKSSPLRGFVTGLMLSGEFQAAVPQALARGTPMPHERGGARPAPEQIAWLAGLLPGTAVPAVSQSADWRAFWAAMLALPGFPGAAPKPAATAEAPAQAAADDGFILITLDQPKAGEKLHPGALIQGAGWAIAPEDIAEIRVTLDDAVLGYARYGLPRTDVARNFPHYRHVDHCGFSFSVQVPAEAVITSDSQIGINVKTVGGQTNRRGVRVAPPAGAPVRANWPIRLFLEDVRVEPGGELRLRGWGLSQANVASISVFLGETDLGRAELGLSRPDIAEIYADYPQAGSSGFVFAANLAGQPPGPAAIRVQLRDAAGESRQVIVPVTVPAHAHNSALADHAGVAISLSGIRLHCEGATLGEAGVVTISGWATAPGEIRDIVAMRGRRTLAIGTRGVVRPDVARDFPMVQGAAEAGYRFSFTPVPLLAAGERLTLRLRTVDGESLTLETPLLPAGASVAGAGGPVRTRLEIDKPVLAGDGALEPVRGALTISGWAVAPAGIAEVSVLCDGEKCGQAYVGMRREDIARAYPDCADSLRAGYALVLPPGAIAEGVHQFMVLATSRDGETQTRSFSVTVEPADDTLSAASPRTRMKRAEEVFARAILAARGCQPVFQIAILPPLAGTVPGQDDAWRASLHSLARQAYGDFSLIIGEAQGADAAAAMPDLAPHVLAPEKGRKKKPAERPARPALYMALHAGDVLGCDALLELAVSFAMDQADFIYADERRHDAVHDRDAPFHKPDWSPQLLLNMDYVGRPWCASQAGMDRAKLRIADFLVTSSYDLVLQLTAAAGKVVHVDKVLAATASVTGPAEGLAALARAAKRLGLSATPTAGVVAGTWRMGRNTHFDGLVSIIIPTAGTDGLVRRAIESIRATTSRDTVEIVVLDNVPASDRAVKAWLADNADQVLAMPGAFNWSRFNNHAVASARGDMLLFLNDDIEAREPGWLEALLEHAVRPEVGVVGARLLYPDGKVQHAGQYLAETHARHAFRFADGLDHGPFGLATVAREMASVTGACQMVRREVFARLSGFDEAHDVVNNDLDFCLRAQAAGLSVIYTPDAALMHHELASRAGIEDSFDAARFSGAWRTLLLRGDRYHSRRLAAEADHYAPDPEPVREIHAGPAGPAIGAIKRILAVKLDHIGDFLTAVPALRALASRFTGARISVLVPPASAVLARREACIDEVIEFTFFHARSGDGQRGVTEQDYAALAARLTEHAFDMAIDLRMHPETRPVLRHTGAPFLVGYDHAASYPWLDVCLEWEGDLRLEAKQAHISERLLSLVDAAAAACRPLEIPVVPPVRDAMSVPALARLPAEFLSRRLVCVHPGVGNPVRQWAPANFAALIDLLAAEEDMHAIIVGGGDEQDVAREVLAAVIARDRVVSLVGALKLGELSEVMSACALFVGNNSGPKHIAAALGLPVLGIHSGVVDAGEWAPLGGAAMALQRRVICGPCYLEFASECPRGLACLTGIRPRDALAACRRLLKIGGNVPFPPNPPSTLGPRSKQ